jgi:formate dehydrogenase iron-sulfur subunit
MTRIYVPCDSSALALGADALAQAIEAEAARPTDRRRAD